MIEVLNTIKKLEADGDRLDASLIDGRVARVQHNISQVEGTRRSDNHVRRLAGLSADVARKGRTKAAVQWIGATAFETEEQAMRVRAFYESVLVAMEGCEPPAGVLDFWQLEEQTDRLLSELRTCHITGDGAGERLRLTEIKRNADAMLRLSVAETRSTVNA